MFVIVRKPDQTAEKRSVKRLLKVRRAKMIIVSRLLIRMKRCQGDQKK